MSDTRHSNSAGLPDEATGGGWRGFMQKLERRMPVTHMALKALPWLGLAAVGAMLIFKAPIFMAGFAAARLGVMAAVAIGGLDIANKVIGSVFRGNEKNAVGQHVEGTRFQLNELAVAQKQITRYALKHKFNERSGVSAKEKLAVANIVKAVLPTVEKVTVNGGAPGYSPSYYDFGVPLNGRVVPVRQFVRSPSPSDQQPKKKKAAAPSA